MARMMGKNYIRKGYCHCCNEINVYGRTGEKRLWQREEDMSIIKYTSGQEMLPGTQPGAPPEVHDEQDRQDQALLGEGDAPGSQD